MRHRLAGSVGISLLAVALLAQNGPAAAGEKVAAEEEIQYRQSVMVVLGRARAQLTAMVKGETPFDAANATRIANFMVELASRTPAGFGPGTEKGAPTKADLKIWKEPAKYKTANDAMITAVGKLPAAAKSKDSLKNALGDAGKTCKSCHDDFKLVEARN
jgi:cytochrome c556